MRQMEKRLQRLEGDPNIYLGWEAKVEQSLMYMRSKMTKKLSYPP